MTMQMECVSTLPECEAAWPVEVDLILSAMEIGRTSFTERRANDRQSYRTRGLLRLRADADDAPLWELYTRDAGPNGLGFITPHMLPLGYSGVVTLRTPGGDELRADCTIYRCRRTVEGWYEGSLKFHRDIWQLR